MAWNAAWSPQFVFTHGPTYKTSISTFDSGKEQRRQKWTSPRRRFHLVYNALDKTTADLIRAEFETAKGAYTSFSWANPADSSSYTVRFDTDSFKQDFISHNVCRMEFDFIEVV